MALFGYIYSFFMVLLCLEIWFIYRPFIAERSRNVPTAAGRLFYSMLALGVREIPERARRIDEKIVALLAGIGIPAACVLTGYAGFIFGAVKANVWWSTTAKGTSENTTKRGKPHVFSGFAAIRPPHPQTPENGQKPGLTGVMTPGDGHVEIRLPYHGMTRTGNHWKRPYLARVGIQSGS